MSNNDKVEEIRQYAVDPASIHVNCNGTFIPLPTWRKEYDKDDQKAFDMPPVAEIVKNKLPPEVVGQFIMNAIGDPDSRMT